MVQPLIPNPIKQSQLESFGKKATPKPKQQPVDPASIIRSVVEEATGDKQAAAQFVNRVAGIVKAKNAQIVQIGRTVFLLNQISSKGQKLPPGTVEMFPFSAEPDQASERIRVLPNTLRQIGIKRMISMTDDPDDVQMMKASGLPIKVGQEMVYDGGQMSPMYLITLDL